MPRPAYTADEREEIEAQIRAVALQLFGTDGYRGVSLRAIAKEMGWSAPALYRYYDNKDALLAALRADGFNELQQILADVRLAADSPVAAGADAMKAYLEFALHQPELYRLMYELDQGEISAHPNVSTNRRMAFAEAEGIAADILTHTGLEGDANQMAHLLWIGAHGLAALAVASQLDLGKQYEELIDPVVQTMLRGIF